MADKCHPLFPPTVSHFWGALQSVTSFVTSFRPLLKADPEGPTLIFYAALQHGFYFTFSSFRASTAHIMSPISCHSRQYFPFRDKRIPLCNSFNQIPIYFEQRSSTSSGVSVFFPSVCLGRKGR